MADELNCAMRAKSFFDKGRELVEAAGIDSQPSKDDMDGFGRGGGRRYTSRTPNHLKPGQLGNAASMSAILAGSSGLVRLPSKSSTSFAVASIDPGVPALFGDSLALALKSGNFGAKNFFEKALSVIERGSDA